MKTRFSQRIIATLLTLAMMVGMLTVLPMTASAYRASETTPPVGSQYPTSVKPYTEYTEEEKADTTLEGDGTADNPYLISNAAEFIYVRETLLHTEAGAAACYKMTADIAFNTATYGTSDSHYMTPAPGSQKIFTGTFDGNRHTIYNLYSYKVAESIALFFNIGTGGVVKNLTLDGVRFVSSNASSGLAATIACGYSSTAESMTGTIANIHVKNASLEAGYVGGISAVADDGGVIENCHVDSLTATKAIRVGGIVYRADGGCLIENCTVGGTLGNTTDTFSAGGIISLPGYSIGSGKKITIRSCTNNATIYAKTAAAGVIGLAQNQEQPSGSGLKNNAFAISDCVNNGDITSAGAYAGGMISQVYKTVENKSLTRCVNNGAVKSTSVSFAGGMIARIQGNEDASTLEIIDCANYGSISATKHSGGMIGFHENGGEISITGSANFGAVDGVNSGGFIGALTGNADTASEIIHITNCASMGVLGADYANSQNSGGAFGVYNAASSELHIAGYFQSASVHTNINSTSAYAGGIVGYYNTAQNSKLTIQSVWINSALSGNAGNVVLFEKLKPVEVPSDCGFLISAQVAGVSKTLIYANEIDVSAFTDGTAQSVLNTYATASSLTPWAKNTTGAPILLTTLGFTGATMSLGGNMSINLKLDVSRLADLDILHVTFVDADTNTGVEATVYDDGYYTVAYDKRAADMAKSTNWQVLITLTNGEQYRSTNILTYSPAKYLTNLYEDYTGKKKDDAKAASVLDVVINMLAYGAESEAKRDGVAFDATETAKAALAAKITLPTTFPYTNEHISNVMTNADTSAINSIALTGASLTGSISVTFQMTNTAYTTLTVNSHNGTSIYHARDGYIIFEDVPPTQILTTYKLVFSGDGVENVTANFCIGDFLEGRRRANIDNDTYLAAATICYMMAVRAYALDMAPVEPAPTVTHTVTFDAAGGTEVAAQTVIDGRSAVAPVAPTRDNYTFVAWTLGGVDYDFSSPVTEDITLVARWKSQGPYTVTFLDADGTELSTQTVAAAGTATKPADPVRNGYIFTGWTLNGNAYDFTTPVTGDIALKAAYTEDTTPVDPPVDPEPPVVDPSVTHVVTFAHVNGTGETTLVSVADGAAVAAPDAPVYNGYTFSHWADAEGNVYNLATPVTGDLILKAVYTRDESVSIPAHTTGSIVINPSHIEFWAGNDLALQLNIQATVTKGTSSVTTDVHYEGMDVTFYSDNPNVVAVSKDGTLTAVSTGTARVWAVIHQGGTQTYIDDKTDYVNYDPFVIHDGTVLYPTVVTIIEQPAYLKLAASDPENQQVQLPTSSSNRINKNDFLALPTGGYGSANIALWYNDATAAMSITVDDNMTADFAQWNEWAQTYGIPISFMVTTSNYASHASLWMSMTELGNAIQPHSHNHYGVKFYTSPYITSAQAWNDSYLSKMEFEAATGIRVLTFAYPCGYNADFNKILYIGGRGVDGLAVYVNNIDYNSVDWQDVPTTAEQIAKLFDPSVTSDRFYTYGGWLNFLEHGVSGRESTYEKFLPLAKEYVDSGELWAAVFSAISQYGQERDTATLTVTSAGANVITFDLTDKMNDMLFDHALTVKIKVDGTWTAARAYQNGAECDTRIVTENGETYVYVNAVPDKGEVTVVRTSIENLTETDDSISFTPVDLASVSDNAMTLTFTVDGTVWTNPYAVQNGNLLTATLKTYGGKTTLTVPFTVGGGEVVIVPVTNQYDARDSFTMYEVWQDFVTPDGTKPVLISTPDDLVMFSEYVRGRGVTAGITFRLTNDIDMSAVESFLPIGWLATHKVPFSGIFDGAEHTISNLTINQPCMNYVGLFGYVNGGTITRLTLDNASVLGVNYVGGLVGRMTKGTINGVAFNGTVTGEGVWRQKNTASHIGGLIGQVDSSTVKNCEINATVDAYASGKNALSHVLSSNGTNAASYVGGVVGEVYYEWGNTTRSTLDNIIFNGDVTAHKAYDGLGAKYIGGFAGYVVNATMTNITINGDVTGGTYVGGLLGYITHTNAWVASSCKNNSVIGAVTGNDYVGGLAGFIAANNQLSFRNCLVLMTVTASENAENVGAVIGSCPYGTDQNASFSSICYMETMNPDMACNPGTVKTAIVSYETIEAALTKLNAYAETNNLPAWRLVDGVPSASYFPVFTVTFLDKDGNVIEEQAVGNTLNAILPEAPFYTGYEFTGWSASHENITAPTTIQALYKRVEVYTVTFVGKDGNTLSTQEINAGLAATAPEAPVLERFTFTGWDKAFDNITEDTVVTAVYVDAFYVTFIYYDVYGVEQSTSVKTTVGETAEAPLVPGTETLRFTGWDTSIENVTEDVTVRAQYVEVSQAASTMNIVQWNLSVSPNSSTTETGLFSTVSATDVILYTGNFKVTTVPSGWAFVQSPTATNGYGEQPKWQAVIFNTSHYIFDEVADIYHKTPPGSIEHGAALAVPLIENSTNKQFVMTVISTGPWGRSGEEGAMKSVMKQTMTAITTQFPAAAGVVVSLQASATAGGAINIGHHASNFYSNLDSTAFVTGYDLVSHYEAQTLKADGAVNYDYATYLLTYMKEGQSVAINTAETVTAVDGISIYNGIRSNITFDKTTTGSEE